MGKLAGDHVRVLVGGYELTGDHNRITFDDSCRMLERTTFGDAAKHYLPGQRMMKLEHAGFVNADAARSHPVMQSAALEGVVSILLGQNATPAVGDPVFSLDTLQSRYSVNPQVDQIVPFSASFGNRGRLGGWGAILAAPTNFINSTDGASVDGGSESSAGGAAHLHVMSAATSDTYVITVEGSTTGSFGGEQSTLATFTLNASQIGSERVAIDGVIPRYTRWKAVRTGSAGDTVQVAVTLIRF